jgi:hypothetical protein
MADTVQDTATADVQEFIDEQGKVKVEIRDVNARLRIATELIRIRHEMTAMRRLMEKRGASGGFAPGGPPGGAFRRGPMGRVPSS